MYQELKNIENLTIGEVCSIIKKSKLEPNVVLAQSGSCQVAIVEFGLVVALQLLVDNLADHSFAIDHFIALKLRERREYGDQYTNNVMRSFVDFRRSIGIEIYEDEIFLKSNDSDVYISGDCKFQRPH